MNQCPFFNLKTRNKKLCYRSSPIYSPMPVRTYVVLLIQHIILEHEFNPFLNKTQQQHHYRPPPPLTHFASISLFQLISLFVFQGVPKLRNIADCQYQFTWATNVICPPHMCNFDKDTCEIVNDELNVRYNLKNASFATEGKRKVCIFKHNPHTNNVAAQWKNW